MRENRVGSDLEPKQILQGRARDGSHLHAWLSPRAKLLDSPLANPESYPPEQKETEASPETSRTVTTTTHAFYTLRSCVQSPLASHCCHFFLGLPTLRLHMHIDMTNSFQAATCSGPLAFAWLPNETGSLLAETPRNFRPVSWITRSNLQLHFESSAVRSILCRRSAIREANTLVAGFSA